MKKGDYVLATRWGDGEPQDPWYVGYYSHTDLRRHFVMSAEGIIVRGNGFRRCEKISTDVGRYLVLEKDNIMCSGMSLWTLVTKLKEYS